VRPSRCDVPSEGRRAHVRFLRRDRWRTTTCEISTVAWKWYSLTSTLIIEGLRVEVAGKEVLRGFDLLMRTGEVT